MKKILAQSTAYQGLVDAFEEKRRKHIVKANARWIARAGTSINTPILNT